MKGLPLFAAVVAHELRNPLSAVKIALQTLERHASMPQDSARVHIALREVATIERLLTDVVDWARPPELNIERTDPAAVVTGAVARAMSALDAAKARVDIDVPEGLTHIPADPERLADALAELIRNAADASPPGGWVRVTVTQTGSATTFTVTDEGESLSAEDCERAFDPFFSRRARGIGLGLARARDIARRHGADVALAKRLAGGARATLRLPGRVEANAPDLSLDQTARASEDRD